MFDYVVIGAGSAGCVLASRLTEDSRRTVLLIEAGPPDRKREIRIPAAFSKLFKSPLDWNFATEPQEHLRGRSLYWPRGKVLGGSSSMNAMVYVRGRRSDFDGWAALGNAGWSHNDVLPFFDAAENQLSIADLRHVNPLTRAFLEACAQSKVDEAALYRVTQKRGARWSAADAYLRPALRRGNLTVWTGIHATRIMIENGRAVGVEYRQDSSVHQVRVTKEVVLSAGAVGSPQLLLLSGIGPRHELKELGIGLVAELDGVGENLQDHLSVVVPYACTRPISLSGAQTLPNLLRFLAGRRGPLTSNVAEAGVFVKSTPDLAEPDLQFHFGPVYYVDHGFTSPAGPGKRSHGFSLGPALLNPKSRGRITLRSADPLDPPRIDPAYLSDRADLAPLAEGVRIADRIIQSKAFDEFRGERYFKEDYAEEFVRAHAETIYHPVGTCRMGIDDGSVVNPRLEVHGVAGLRVADASVMPTIVSGNTNSATIMIAEKAARLIKE